MSVVCKLLSGRFILTCISGIVFAWMSITGILDPKDSMAIMLVVFTSYFQKRRDDGEEAIKKERGRGGEGK